MPADLQRDLPAPVSPTQRGSSTLPEAPMLTAKSHSAKPSMHADTLRVPEATTLPGPSGSQGKLVKRKTSAYSLGRSKASMDRGRAELGLVEPLVVEKKTGHKKHGFASWFGKRRG